MWLVEAGELRLLCDPLLGETHHGGVFEVVPRRRVHAEALRADFVLVSHRHPDHFDVPSLHALAQIDADSVVLTPDALVAWAATQLGFRTVRIVAPGEHVGLDGVELVTTPSLATDEWGVMIADDDGVVWNLVDTVLRDAAHVRDVRDRALAGMGRIHLDLALVRWQPMLEIAAPLGRATGFPMRDYAELLHQCAALAAGAVVPSACGGAHTEPYAWMDRYVYPVTARRFLRDLGQLAPDVDAFPAQIGARFSVVGGETAFDPTGASELVTITEDIDPRIFRPLHMPALVDPHVGGHDEAMMRAQVAAWIEGPLGQALQSAWPSMGVTTPLTFVVEVTFPRVVEAYSLRVGPGGLRVRRGFDDDWDALNLVAGSLLWEVIDGRRHWGDVVLTGALRAATRAYTIGFDRVQRANVAETFLYYALSYDDSVERAVRWEVARAQRTGK
jgi:hypothetical protein